MSGVAKDLNITVPPRFEVETKLGQGGMATVFLAYDKIDERKVALKFLPPSDDQKLKQRFHREAADLALVCHPNVVDFYSVGESGEQEFIVMEYVDGGTLTKYLSNCNSLKEALEVYAQICDGLAHIHENGLVHRDIKPANILMTEDGVPKISDLGLARQQEARTQLTQDGTLLGTAAYLAPEQLRSHAVDHLADLYALGVCLFEAVTNDKPFPEAMNPLAILRAHFEEEPPTPSSVVPGLPVSIDELVLSLMEKEPENRPQSADAVALSLRKIASELTEAEDKLVASTNDALLARAQYQLNAGDWKSAERVLETFDSDQNSSPEFRLLKCRLLVKKQVPSALRFCQETVELCRQEDQLKLLGAALVSQGQAALQVKEWELAESSLTEARGLVSSSDKELQIRMLETLAEVYTSGPKSEEPGTREKAVQFRKIAEGLSKRSQSGLSKTSALKPDTRPAKSSPSFDRSKQILALGSVVLLACLFFVWNWWNNRPGKVFIDSEPAGSTILINGERHYSPLTLELPKGEHKLKVFKQGYKAHEETISLQAGGNFQLKATLESASGQISFTTVPPKSVIFIDDQKKGESPLELQGLPPRTYKVKVKREGYIAYEGKVEVVAGKTRNLSVTLKKVPPPPPRYSPRSYNRGYSRPRRRSGKGDGYFKNRFFKVKNPF